MKIGNQIEALELTMNLGGNSSTIHPVLLWDDKGAVLVDTGLPGQLEDLKKAIEQAGSRFEDIRHIIITHQDIDHIGGLPEILDALGGKAEIWAHNDDVPYIQGERPLIKMNKERMTKMFESLPESDRARGMAMLENPPKAHVAHILHGGELLDFHGGVRVIHTPGHTPGHLCLFVENEGLLIAADELRVVDGKLEGPAEQATPDMKTALESLHKLPPYDVQSILCYHGGLYNDNAREKLSELAHRTQG